MAAAMLAMVCRFTVGRPRYADVETEVQGILQDTLAAQERLVQLADADIEAYGSVRDAYALSRASDDERAARTEAIARSMSRATEVPVQTAEVARTIVALCERAADITNPNLLGDVAVAVHLAASALRAAAEQASLNLNGLSDSDFVSAMWLRLDAAQTGLDEIVDETVDSVRARAAS
jgi:formiminotetrahydrofolate cyclodeaminase